MREHPPDRFGIFHKPSSPLFKSGGFRFGLFFLANSLNFIGLEYKDAPVAGLDFDGFTGRVFDHRAVNLAAVFQVDHLVKTLCRELADYEEG